MKIFIILAAIVAVVWSQQMDIPNPYSFNYVSNTEDGGSSSHEESGDGNGRVSGTYSVTDLEGHNRVVEYTADENGFRANVRTNEPGTANINPADVNMESSAEGAGALSYNIGASSGQAAPRVAAQAGPRMMAGGPRMVAPGPRMVAPGRPRTRYMLMPVTE